MDYSQLHVGDVVEAMSDHLRRWANKKAGLPGSDKNGVLTLYNQKQKGLLMFVFVTPDSLKVELEFDLRRMVAEGYQEYIAKQTEILITQLDAARKEKQNNDSMLILPAKKDVLTSPIESAVLKSLNVGTLN